MTQEIIQEGFHIRPRFEVKSDKSIKEIMDCVQAGLKVEFSACKGTVSNGFISLRPHDIELHYWSPYLTVNLEEENEETLARCLFGPSPGVWTMFIFIYAIVGLAIVIISIIGLSNWSLGDSAKILWFVPFLIMVFLTLYLVSFLGQKRGNHQMRHLHDFVMECL